MGRESRKDTRRPIAGEVGISWQDADGQIQFTNVKGVDLSDSGILVESSAPINVDSFVRVHAEQFGFTCAAVVRHRERRGALYTIGLEFRRSTAQPPQQSAPEEFTDFYELMQISPAADLDTIHRVYRLVAARYHPDNIHTGDLQKFLLLQQAYETVSDPTKRAAYDTEYHFRRSGPVPLFELKDFVVGIDAETNRRLGILCLLYNRRRVNPDHPGLSMLEFERLMTIPREHLVFTVWFLKEKRLLRTDGSSEFEITAEGVEFVEKALPSNQLMQKLLRAPAETWPENTPQQG